MKKEYLIPAIELVPYAPEIMDVNLYSVELKGNVTTEEESTNWGFGGDSNKDDTPDAKINNIWDGWDD